MDFWNIILFFVISLVFFLCGLLMWRRPDLTGGEFKLMKSSTFYSIKYIKASNVYLLKQVRHVGIGFIIAGLLSVIFTIAYIIQPEVLQMFQY